MLSIKYEKFLAFWLALKNMKSSHVQRSLSAKIAVKSCDISLSDAVQSSSQGKISVLMSQKVCCVTTIFCVSFSRARARLTMKLHDCRPVDNLVKLQTKDDGLPLVFAQPSHRPTSKKTQGKSQLL